MPEDIYVSHRPQEDFVIRSCGNCLHKPLDDHMTPCTECRMIFIRTNGEPVPEGPPGSPPKGEIE